MWKTKLVTVVLVALAAYAACQGLELAVPFLSLGRPPMVAPPDTPPVVVATVQGDIRIAPPRPAQAGGTLRVTARASHGIVPAGQAEAWVEVDLEAAPGRQGQRLPVNLALVLDRSASMAAKNKLEYAKEAARLAVGQLRAGDRVAIVAFDSVSNVLLPSTPVRDHQAIEAIIDGLTPGGSTNISDGLADGRAEVARHLRRDWVNRIILMTDGLANFGIRDPDELSRVAREYGQQGVSISAMGLGHEYNEDLLVALAEYSGGRYHYIEDPQQMASIFKTEVRELAAVVARGVTVELAGASGAQVSTVLARKAAETINGRWSVPLGDMVGGQRRRLIARVTLPDARSGVTQAIVRVRVAYTDALGGNTGVEVPLAIEVARSSDAADHERSAQKDVLETVQTALGATELEEAMRRFQSGKREEAQQLLLTAESRYRSLNATLRSAKLEKLQERYKEVSRQIGGLEADSEAGRGYVKAQKAWSYKTTW